jgi:hypothetical protein
MYRYYTTLSNSLPRGSPCGTGAGLSPNSCVPCQYHSTMTLHAHISPGGWTISLLVAAVKRQRHSLTPSIWTTKSHSVLSCRGYHTRFVFWIHRFVSRPENLVPLLSFSWSSDSLCSHILWQCSNISHSTPLQATSLFMIHHVKQTLMLK